MEEIERRLRRSGDDEAMVLLREYVHRNNVRYARLARRTMIAVGVVGLFVVAGLVAQAVVIENGVDEAKTRREQFCHLVNGTYADKVKQYRNTIIYLSQPAGREPTGFNEYIRKVALPQTRKDVMRGRQLIPPACEDVEPVPEDITKPETQQGS